jgi:hypothetical protein
MQHWRIEYFACNNSDGRSSLAVAFISLWFHFQSNIAVTNTIMLSHCHQTCQAGVSLAFLTALGALRMALPSYSGSDHAQAKFHHFWSNLDWEHDVAFIWRECGNCLTHRPDQAEQGSIRAEFRSRIAHFDAQVLQQQDASDSATTQANVR